MYGRRPTGRVWCMVFGLSVDGEHSGSSVESRPKYAGSDSRPGVSHSSPARVKFRSLSESHTPRTNSEFPPITHWSGAGSQSSRSSIPGSQGADASTWCAIGSSECRSPQQVQVQPGSFAVRQTLTGAPDGPWNGAPSRTAKTLPARSAGRAWSPPVRPPGTLLARACAAGPGSDSAPGTSASSDGGAPCRSEDRS